MLCFIIKRVMCFLGVNGLYVWRVVMPVAGIFLPFFVVVSMWVCIWIKKS
jgi:hypothetical protein